MCNIQSIIKVLGLGLGIYGSSIVGAFAADQTLVPLPKDLEVKLALTALPLELRKDATVLTRDPTRGYVVHSQGTNGFTTLVGRSSTRFYQGTWDYAYPSDQLIPMAYDQIGVEHHLQPYFDLAKMRINKVSPTEAKATLRRRFADGTYRAPTKGGLSYMLAPIHRAYMQPEKSDLLGTVSFPHYMPYAPHVTAQQIGNNNPMKGPFALNHGAEDTGPHGYLVIKLADKEITRIQKENTNLLKKLCALHENWCLPNFKN